MGAGRAAGVSRRAATGVRQLLKKNSLERTLERRQVPASEERWVPVAYRGAQADGAKGSFSGSRDFSKPNEQTAPRQRIKYQRFGKPEDTLAEAATERRRRKEADLMKQCENIGRAAILYQRGLIAPANEIEHVDSLLKAQPGDANDVALRYHLSVLGKLLPSIHNSKLVNVAELIATQQTTQTGDTDVLDSEQVSAEVDEAEGADSVSGSAKDSDDIFGLQTTTTSNLETKIEADIIDVDLERVVETEESFRSLCYRLHSLATESSSLLALDLGGDHAIDDEAISNMLVTTQLSLLSLRALDQICNERKRLVGAVTSKQEVADEEDDGWLKSVSKFARSLGSAQESSREQKLNALQHDYRHLAPTMQMYLTVMKPLLTPCLDFLSSPPKSQTKKQNALKVYRAATSCLVDILQQVPEDNGFEVWDAKTRQDIFSLLSQRGTLESAGWCSRLAQSMAAQPSLLGHPGGDVSMIVWQSYLEAAKNRDRPESEREEAALHLYQHWVLRWKTDFPTSLTERTEQTALVLSGLSAAAGSSKQNSELASAADTVARRYMGHRPYSRFLSSLDSPESTASHLKKGNPAFFDALATNFCFTDFPKAEALIRALLAEDLESFPSGAAINSYVRNLWVRCKQLSKDEVSSVDVGLVMSLLRPKTLPLLEHETFWNISRILTIVSPEGVGQHFLTWLACYEIFCLMDGGDVSITRADYNRVLWGLWQQAKTQSAAEGEDEGDVKEDAFNCSKQAWKLLRKMESMSRPLLLSTKEVANTTTSQQPPYNIDVQPSKRAFEIVLNIAADTRIPGEFEGAAEVVVKAVDLAKRNKAINGLDLALVRQCVDTCKARLDDGSPLVAALAELQDELSPPKDDGEAAA